MGIPVEQVHRPYSWHIVDDPEWAGAPLGGIGAGSIGRSYRGDFSRWHTDIGTHKYDPRPACQFSLFTETAGGTQAHVLAPLKPEVLKDWNWDMPAGAGTYHALYPRSWYQYQWDALPVTAVQKQFSPVIPGNYRESSWPVAVFEWELTNPTDKPVTVSVMFSWENLTGYPWNQFGKGGHTGRLFREGERTGILMTRGTEGSTGKEWEGSWTLMTEPVPGGEITGIGQFAVDKSGKPVWDDFSADGLLTDSAAGPSAAGQLTAGALAVKVTLQPGATVIIPFTLAWDYPVTTFDKGTSWYKRYVRYFDESGKNGIKLASAALDSRKIWEEAIIAWQQPILDDPERPLWYKTALFNELYYLVDGGTVWETGQPGKGVSRQGTGHFAWLETYDYLYYNTFDVHFYASWALALLWPDLQKSLIRDFVASVPVADKAMVTIGATGQTAPRKTAGAVPHDLGSPAEDPWLRYNTYNWQDINIWKDLNSKFVLQVWRDATLLDDPELLTEAWPAVVQALEYLKTFDRDGDGLPEHDGVADQTYDTWEMTGAGTYSAGLFVAALDAGFRMAVLNGDTANEKRFGEWLAAARTSYVVKLWTGEYFRYDTRSDSIMADQLCGQWYAGATGLDPVAPLEMVDKALKTVFAFNVNRFQNGEMGAVNGMTPDGKVDRVSEQSQEVWTGTTYALAALMMNRGMKEEAWKTAWGIFNVTYNRGYWFRTPEAWNEEGDYRASLYMRPLSIWAMEHELQ
jgi:non-lysosomal glucosylceramidase